MQRQNDWCYSKLQLIELEIDRSWTVSEENDILICLGIYSKTSQPFSYWSCDAYTELRKQEAGVKTLIAKYPLS